MNQIYMCVLYHLLSAIKFIDICREEFLYCHSLEGNVEESNASSLVLIDTTTKFKIQGLWKH